MKNLTGFGLWLTLVITFTACQGTQTTAPASAPTAAEAAPAMIMTATVPLEGVKGRFDHFASGKGKVFVSGLGNNSVEIIDLFQGTRSHEITGVPNPQGEDGLRWCPVALTTGYHHVRPPTGTGTRLDNS